jgi:hypothetical protein
MFPSCHQASKAFAQPHLRFLADILDGFRLLFEPQLYLPTDFGGVAIDPSPFDQGTTRMGIPGFGNGPLPVSLTAGVFQGDQTQEFHQLPRVLKARQVAEFSHGGDGHGALHATQGLESFDDRI